MTVRLFIPKFLYHLFNDLWSSRALTTSLPYNIVPNCYRSQCINKDSALDYSETRDLINFVYIISIIDWTLFGVIARKVLLPKFTIDVNQAENKWWWCDAKRAKQNSNLTCLRFLHNCEKIRHNTFETKFCWSNCVGHKMRFWSMSKCYKSKINFLGHHYK